jgi:hypothetical protein
MSILVVDDLRVFGSRFQGKLILYAINSGEGLRQLDDHAEELQEIWLDHDLGGDDTVIPIVNWIEEDFHNKNRLQHLGCIRILTNNPVGFQKIKALERYVTIAPTPQHIGIRGLHNDISV